MEMSRFEMPSRALREKRFEAGDVFRLSRIELRPLRVCLSVALLKFAEMKFQLRWLTTVFRRKKYQNFEICEIKAK